MTEVAIYRPSIPRLFGVSLGIAVLPTLIAPRSWGGLAAAIVLWLALVTFGRWFFTVRVNRDSVVGAGMGGGQGRVSISVADLRLDTGPDAEIGEITITSKSSGDTISVSLLSKKARTRLVRTLESRLRGRQLS